MKYTLLSITALLVFPMGCLKNTARRDVDAKVETPISWQALEQETALQFLPEKLEDSWWRDFGDDALNQAVTEALASNRTLLEAQAMVKAAAEAAVAAGAERFPTVGLDLGGGRQKQNFIGLPLPGGQEVIGATYTQHRGGITASWEADLWGRIKANTRMALSEYEASVYDLKALRLSIAGGAVKAWLKALEASQQEALAEEMSWRFQKEVQQVKRRYEKGLKSSLDLRLSQSNHASTQALLKQRKQQRAAVARQLRIIMGQYPSNEPFAKKAFPPLPSRVPIGLPADLISRRPDMAAAESRLLARDQGLVAARRALYPRLTLTASAGSSASDLSDLLKGDFSVWSIAGGLVQPLFQGGRLRANVRSAEFKVDAQLHHFANLALTAYSEVEGALENEKWLRLREADLTQAHAQSEAAAKRAEDSYYKGLVDYLSVLVAQRQALAARSELIAVRSSLLINRVDLYMALGGGFQNPTTQGPRY